MLYNLLDLETVLRKIGRGTVWYAHDGTGPLDIGSPIKWDGTTALQLAPISDTEGEIVRNPNADIATLTLPELSGTAVHEATAVGGNPTLSVPLFLADPDLLAILSETGLAGMGHFRVRDVSGVTIVIFPEALFRKDDGTYAQLSFTGGTWLLDGGALGAARTTLLGHSTWFWNAYIMRPEFSFRGGHGDDAKNIETVEIRGMFHSGMPDGQRIFTIGDPTLVGIDLEGGS